VSSVHVFQIYYDAASRAALDPGFTPLDNTANERPDWYELWVIRNYLRSHTLADGDWYGFLSPHFRSKTGLGSDTIRQFLDFARDKVDVALILTGWDQVAYFQNPFEQGEVWHPGITALAEAMLSRIGHRVDLAKLVTCSGNFTFANYIVARAAYWRQWLALADAFFDLVEQDTSTLAADLRRTTAYGNAANQAPVKAFIQERLPALILADRGKFRTATLDTSDTFPIFDRLFEVDAATRGVLQTCDGLKKKYVTAGDPECLEMFRHVRGLVKTKFPSPPAAAAAPPSDGRA
jgi:hypothetical protein